MNNKDLKLSYWLVSVQPHIKKVVFALIVLVDLVSVSMAVYAGALYVSTGRKQAEMLDAMTENLVRFASAYERQAPPAPTITQETILEESAGKYSLVAVVANASERWMLKRADVHFLIDGEEVAIGETSLLPSEERFVVSFGYASSSLNPRARLSVELRNEEWVNSAKTDTIPYEVSVTEPQFRILSSAPTSQLSQITAVLTNETVHDFKDLRFTALLFNNRQIVGVGELLIDAMPSLSSRPVDIRIFRAMTVTDVSAHASIDVAQVILE